MADVNELSSRIDTIERGYEYLLAYAAQGRQSDEGSEARARLQAMFDALNGLGERVASCGECGGGCGCRGLGSECC